MVCLTDGERGHSNHTPDENPDTPSAADKLDPPADGPATPTPTTTTTSTATNKVSNVNNNGGSSLSAKADAGLANTESKQG